MSEQARRETWRDWAPDAGAPPLLTRAEVLAALKRLGLAVSERTLRYWVSTGVVPAHTLLREGGEGYYPWWIVDLLFSIRRWQDQQLGLAAIRPLARGEVRRLSRHPFNGLADSEAQTAWMRQYVIQHHTPSDPGDPAAGLAEVLRDAAPTFIPLAYAAARLYGERVGQRVAGVALLIETADGQKTPLALPPVEIDP